MRRPAVGEYPDYYKGYIELVPDGDIIDIITSQLEETLSIVKAHADHRDFRYAEGKWSLIEVVGHMIDTERIQAYRILRMARGDKTPLAGYDDERYVEAAHFSERSLDDLLEEFLVTRAATIALIRGLPKHAWESTGLANNGEFTVSSLAYIIAGHELHHRKLIVERYLV